MSQLRLQLEIEPDRYIVVVRMRRRKFYARKADPNMIYPGGTLERHEALSIARKLNRSIFGCLTTRLN